LYHFPALCLLVQFGKLEAYADNVGGFVFGPVAVGGGDDGAVGEEFDTGIGAVGSLGVVHQSHAVLTLAIGQDVLVGSNPGDLVSFGWRFVGGVAEGNEESAVGRINAGVAIPGE